MNEFLARTRDFARLWSQRALAAARAHPWRAAALVPLLPLLYVLILYPFTPSIGDLRKAKQEAPALVLSADGKELAAFKRANREWVKLKDISPHVTTALIATEDHRFNEHHGIDVKRTLAAVFRTLSGDTQGGSTITQQLARNLYPDDIGRSVSITRKLKEAITALKIEAVYTKAEILETYLNTVPFLYNAYGIEMAARTYFDKSADQLDVLQSATLIGMLKGTSYYNPVQNPERAVQRRNIVLGQMVKHDKLTAKQFEVLKRRPLKVDFERQTEPLGSAPHVTQQLRRWLIDWADRNGYNIYADGLIVRTTIDSRIQDAANTAVRRQADRLQPNADGAWARATANREVLRAFIRETAAYKTARESGLNEEQAIKKVQTDLPAMRALREDKTRLQAGFLALDPRNGEVRAWVGSRAFSKDQFDHVQQARRQPGSTFKPFTYGAAFAQGMSPNDTFLDGDVEIVIDGGNVWRPSDAGGPSYTNMTLRDGLSYSKNTITAQLVNKVGAASVAKFAWALGVRQSRLEEVPSLALGTSPVTLKEMVTAYSTIANGGSYFEPFLVTSVEDRHGKVLERFKAKRPQVAIERLTADVLLDVMRGVIERGTGTAIRSRFGIAADVAGKTGTTSDNTDSWFILMHSQLVAGAWMGFNDNRVTMQDSWGQGARAALPIVGETFQKAFAQKVIDSQLRFAAPVIAPPPPPPPPAPEPGIFNMSVGVPGVPIPAAGGTAMPEPAPMYGN